MLPLLLLALAHAQAPACANPREAADSLFVDDPALAAACLDVPPGESGPRLAEQLKQVLDARGHWVPVPSLSTNPDFVDDSGDARVVPMPGEFPLLVLERAPDGRWLYARGTLDAVPALYAETFSELSLWFQAQLPPVFYQRLFGLRAWQVFYAVLLLIVAWTAGRAVHVLLSTQVRRVVRRAGFPIDDGAYVRTQRPLVLLTAAAVVLWGLPDLQLSIDASRTVHLVTRLVLALAAVFAASRFVDVGAAYAAARARKTESRLDDQVIPLVRQAAQVVVWTLGVLFLLQNQGVDVFSLVAGLGIGGLAFALAAKDTVANLFGSLNIFLDRPFQIGDWVKIGEVEGTVEEVGFRSTRVRTFYNSLVTIPNSSITSANVDNLGLRHRRRVKTTLGLTYDTPPDKLQAFVEGIRAILAAHPAVQRSYEVHFHDFGPSSLDVLVYYHLVVPSWSAELEARAQNLLEILRLADDLGVSFAFPSTSVYVESTPEHPLQTRETPSLPELEAIAAAYGPDGARARPLGPPFTRSFSVAARNERGS